MGLIKTVPDPQQPGQIDCYARYTLFVVNPANKVMRLDVASYRSQAARDADYPPVRTETFTLTNNPALNPAGWPTYDQFQAQDNANPNGVGAQIYGFLKAFTAWADAKDA